MSLKLQILLSPLDFFPENMEAVSDKPGGSFHQDISQTDKRFSEKWCLICWLNTAGVLQGRHQLTKTRGKIR
jgi:hypothetical protein